MCVFGVFVSISGPTTYKLLIDQICSSHSDNLADDGNCEAPEIQAIYANYKSWSIISTGVVSSLVASKVGQFSDMYGRKNIFILMSSIMLISECIRLLLFYPGKQFSFGGLILADIIVSLDGGGITGFGRLAESYISDIVSAEERISAMIIVVGCAYGGLFIGPFLSNVLLSLGYSEYSVLTVSVAFGVVYLLFTIIVLPESRSKMARIRSRNQLQDLQSQEEPSFLDKINVLKPMKILYVSESRRKRVVFPLITFVMLVIIAGASSAPLLQHVGFKLHINASQLGTISMIIGAMSCASLLLIAPFMVKYLNSVYGAKEKRLDMIDLAFISIYALSLFIRGLLQCGMTNITIYYVYGAVEAIGYTGDGAVYSAMVKYFDRRNSGQMYGAMGSLSNIMSLVLQPKFLYLYKTTYAKWSNFVFVLNAMIQVSIFPLLMWLRYIVVTGGIDDIEVLTIE